MCTNPKGVGNCHYLERRSPTASRIRMCISAAVRVKRVQVLGTLSARAGCRRRPTPVFSRTNACLFLLQVEADGIDAIALAGLCRPVVENVSEVRAATDAGDLGSTHPMRRVVML